ncbi:EthD family reductase [Mesorhizobium sp. Z1-4]|uniref:EthD family reductase n=1 Tax=Mesorhizobium sp. Z1-4 TaxID=2448478 RepID=UPI000FD9BA39|nr:EthD family reductase [Mesorhizobium sp. Z1-4]
MTVSYFVIYRGSSADQHQFIAHYESVHVPILLTLPGIVGVTVHNPVTWHDSKPVNASRFALIAQLEFLSREALCDALQSEQRAHAREDMEANFPAFEGVVWHQAVQSQRYVHG